MMVSTELMQIFIFGEYLVGCGF